VVGPTAGAVVAVLLLGAFAQPIPTAEIPRRAPAAIVFNLLPLLALLVSPVALLVPWLPADFWTITFVATLAYGLAVRVFRVLTQRDE
jgi:hypothetical protein